jgi:hypothetical protein
MEFSALAKKKPKNEPFYQCGCRIAGLFPWIELLRVEKDMLPRDGDHALPRRRSGD